MVPLQIEHAVEPEITPREPLSERIEGALILLSLAAVEVGWCSLLALMIWKGFAWIF
jgi:hypothetical protein